jgi:hypothetical protein
MKADYCKCDVALGGDLRNVLHATNLTWPEVCVMSELHGENAVSNIVVTHTGEVDMRAEIDRMRFTYPPHAVQALYPGANPNIKFEAPDYIEREAPKAAHAKKPEPVAQNKTADLL